MDPRRLLPLLALGAAGPAAGCGDRDRSDEPCADGTFCRDDFEFYITTGLAEDIGPSRATLTAVFDPGGEDTDIWFEWTVWKRFALEFDHATPRRSLGPGTGPLRVAVRITDLSPGTRYAFRPRAENARGPGVGGIETFTTPGI